MTVYKHTSENKLKASQSKKAQLPFKELRFLEAFSLFLSFVLTLLAGHFENEYFVFGGFVLILICVFLYYKLKITKDKLSGVGHI